MLTTWNWLSLMDSKRNIYFFSKGYASILLYVLPQLAQETGRGNGRKNLKAWDLKGTRWVPHLHLALKVFLKDYKVIKIYFNNTVAASTSSTEMQGRAKKILKEQEKFTTVIFANFTLNVLNCLSNLSALFQKDITSTEAKDGFDNTTLQLTAMIARPGPCLEETPHSIGDGKDYKGITLKRSAQDFIHFNKTTKECVIKCIIQYLEERFQNITDQTLLAMSVFDTTLWPDVWGRQNVPTCSTFKALIREK